MKGSRKRRHLTPKVKRATLAVCIFLSVVLLAYAEIIRPDQDAKAYATNLGTASKPLEKCFEQLAKTTESQLFYAPDISLDTKQQDVTSILSKIKECRTHLSSFETASHHLLGLHLAGYTKSYRQAKIYQRQAFDVIGQSDDVMDQYELTATFLSQYYAHIAAYTSYIDSLQNDSTYFSSTRIQSLSQQAADLRERANSVRSLQSPQEFTTTRQATADMLSMAADGLDGVAKGYLYANDYAVSNGYAQIDKASNTYYSSVINLPFDQLIKSYIPKQVDQLPVKIDNLLTASSE
jgi:hypothetical protein